MSPLSYISSPLLCLATELSNHGTLSSLTLPRLISFLYVACVCLLFCLFAGILRDAGGTVESQIMHRCATDEIASSLRSALRNLFGPPPTGVKLEGLLAFGDKSALPFKLPNLISKVRALSCSDKMVSPFSPYASHTVLSEVDAATVRTVSRPYCMHVHPSACACACSSASAWRTRSCVTCPPCAAAVSWCSHACTRYTFWWWLCSS